MRQTSEDRRLAARILLEIGAVQLRPEAPFTLTSGRLSPVYVDCRKIISHPRARDQIMDMGVRLIKDRIGSLDVIAGGETAGIPFAAWLAERLDLPMIYVRKQPKGFGRMAQIEGDLDQKSRVLLVEDLATDGGSKVGFVNALRQAGAQIDHIFVVFHYGTMPESRAVMRNLGVELFDLVQWEDVLSQGLADQMFDAEMADTIRGFLDHPDAWEALESNPVKGDPYGHLPVLMPGRENFWACVRLDRPSVRP